MKIVFTGGGSGGHFFPIIAIAQEINALVAEQKLVLPKLYYVGPEPYDRKALYENSILFKQSPAGKIRRYFSLLNVIDLTKTAFGIVRALLLLFSIYPDVVFSKGGYASFPTVFAARLLRIPVIIHESDAVPGRANKWAGKFAQRVAISYPEVGKYFDSKKVAFTGIPVRKELFTIAHEGGQHFLDLEEGVPTVLILTGSQGAQRINDIVIDALPRLVERYQIIHQTGRAHITEVTRTAEVVLEKNAQKARYRPFDFLDPLALRMAAGAADIVLSRAGSGTIFEIALWGIPSIVIPIPETISHDQRENAFAYARSGAATVIEEGNLTPNVLVAEIERILTNEKLKETMSIAAKKFSKPNAARTIAEEIVKIALTHEIQ
jgi:UDP-N-acetylglucosamine--N-acetylmuramyl-(pentapeptide) pyrophosphoryl-undecaprenol N-acetylglucosamine transferase